MTMNEAGKDYGCSISELLQLLGETANHVGFHYTVCAVQVAIENPDCLLMVTKWLYPETAKRMGVAASAIERGIRSTVELVWSREPEQMQKALNVKLLERPTASAFVAMLCVYYQSMQ